MALPMDRLQDVLPLLPDEIREKTKIIYQQIPGSLLKYLNPASINQQVECRERDLVVNPSIPIEHSTERNQHRSTPQQSSPQTSSNPKINNQPSNDHSMHENQDNKYANALRFYLQRSIQKSFINGNITVVNPNSVADDIVQNCFRECPDWGRKKCKTSSVIIRFNSKYTEQKPRAFNVNVYTYAYLSCERDESRLPRLHESPPRIRFELTIELTGLMVSSEKITQFKQLLSNNIVKDVIQIIAGNSKATENNLDQTFSQLPTENHLDQRFAELPTGNHLDQPFSKPPTETKSLSWDDI